MATLATETFTGTTGAAWPTQWVNGSTQGTATIQANAGRLLADRNGYRRVNRFLNVAAAAACELYVEVTIPALTEAYTWVFVRADSSRGDLAYPLGYGVVLKPADGVFTLELGYGTGESLQTDVPFTFAAGGKYGVRVGAPDSNFRAKVWNLTGSEPTAWSATTNDGDNSFPTGRVELGYLSGQSANPGTTFDNLTLTDGATGGTVTLSGGGTLAASGTPKPVATLARTGTGTLARAGTPRTAGAVALTGTGTLNVTGTPSAADGVSLSSAGTLTTSGTATITGTRTATADAALAISTTPAVTADPITSTASGTLTVDGALDADATVALDVDGTLTIAGSPRVSGTAILTASGSLALAGQGSSSGSATLDRTGGGQLTPKGAPAVAGQITTATAGLLLLGGTPTLADTISIAGSGTLTLIEAAPLHLSVITATLGRRATTATLPPRTMAASTARAWKATLHADHPS